MDCMNTDKINLENIIPDEYAGKRLDQALALLYPEHSRERIKDWIKSGDCLVDGNKLQPKNKVSGGEKIIIDAEIEAQVTWEAEPIDLDIVYEDEDLIIINKPRGLVVHPGSGNPSGTLVNALLHHCPSLENIPRAGVVHRIDKDTTGLMVIAKTLIAHTSLVEQLQSKELYRIYEALVKGEILAGGHIDLPIGRHPNDRIKMAVTDSGKPAVTHYRVLNKFGHFTHVQCQLETGRTHQIRVHMAHIKHPIIGDRTYGGRFKLPPNASVALVEALQGFSRQALHAKKLGLMHPATGEYKEWEVPLADDFENLLGLLKQEYGK